MVESLKTVVAVILIIVVVVLCGIATWLAMHVGFAILAFFVGIAVGWATLIAAVRKGKKK